MCWQNSSRHACRLTSVLTAWLWPSCHTIANVSPLQIKWITPRFWHTGISYLGLSIHSLVSTSHQHKLCVAVTPFCVTQSMEDDAWYHDGPSEPSSCLSQSGQFLGQEKRLFLILCFSKFGQSPGLFFSFLIFFLIFLMFGVFFEFQKSRVNKNVDMWGLWITCARRWETILFL